MTYGSSPIFRGTNCIPPTSAPVLISSDSPASLFQFSRRQNLLLSKVTCLQGPEIRHGHLWRTIIPPPTKVDYFNGTTGRGRAIWTPGKPINTNFTMCCVLTSSIVKITCKSSCYILRWITNCPLCMYSTRNSAQYYVAAWMRGEFGGEWMRVYIWLNPFALHLELSQHGSLATPRYKICVCAKSLQSCPTLCNPMECSLPGSSVHGILQAKTLEWTARSFSTNTKISLKKKNICIYIYTHK